MAKFRSIKNSLIAGEISPTAFGRTDLPQYPHACKLMRNMIPILSGGAYRRPGTVYDGSEDYSTDAGPALITFSVSKNESYCVEVGSTLAGSPYLKAFRATSPYVSGSTSTITGSPPWLPRHLTDVLTYGGYDEFHEVQYAQSADIMWLVYPRYKPQKLQRTSQDHFSIAAFDNGLSGTSLRDAYPYRAQNTTTTLTLTPSATTGNITVTASSALFNSLHVGALFKVNDGGTYACFKVTGYTSSTVVSATVVVNFAGTTARATWWESSWSDYRGWPRSVGFFQGRIAYAGNSSQPDSSWYSSTGDYGTMSVAAIVQPTSPGNGTTGPAGTQPFQIDCPSTELNLVQWMSPGESLLLGTTGAEFSIYVPDRTIPFGCDNFGINSKSQYGSSYNQASRMGSEVAFVGLGEDQIKALAFSNDEQAYAAEPVQLLYDEFPHAEPAGSAFQNRKIRKVQWDSTRNTLWCLDTAGNFVGLTREKSIGVSAWHSHQFGGFDSTHVGAAIDTGGAVYTADPNYLNCAGSVVSFTVTYNPQVGLNDVWLIVKRYVNGSFVYHRERMIGGAFQYDTAYSTGGGFLTDASVSITNVYLAPTIVNNVFSGLDHLDGETPSGTAFNAHGIFEISGGAISSGDSTITTMPTGWDTETTVFVMGLAYDSKIIPVRPEAGSQIGTSQGAIKRVHDLTIRFWRTLSAKVGADDDNLETIIFREGDTPIGSSPDLYTGDKQIKADCDYDRDAYIEILQDAPLPFSVLGIIAEGQTYD